MSFHRQSFISSISTKLPTSRSCDGSTPPRTVPFISHHPGCWRSIFTRGSLCQVIPHCRAGKCFPGFTHQCRWSAPSAVCRVVPMTFLSKAVIRRFRRRAISWWCLLHSRTPLENMSQPERGTARAGDWMEEIPSSVRGLYSCFLCARLAFPAVPSMDFISPCTFPSPGARCCSL